MSPAGPPSLDKADDRVKSVPFAVDSATLDSVLNVHRVCSTILASPRSIDDTSEHNDHKPSFTPPVVLEKLPTIPVHETEKFVLSYCRPSVELIEACKLRDLAAVESLLSSLPASDRQEIISRPEDAESWLTPLHFAAIAGDSSLVTILLQQGANPCKKDIRGRTPYHSTDDKNVRIAFRKYRGEMESDGLAPWDWDDAGIGPGITDETENTKKEKEKERKRRAKQKKKDDQAKDEVMMRELEERARLEHVEAEKRAQQEQDRLRTLAGNCEICSSPLYAKEVLTVQDRRVCSSACVAVLRRKLAAEAAEKRFVRSK